MQSGSSGVAGFTGVRPGVHPVLLGSMEYALSVFMFIQDHWVYWSPPWVSPGSSIVAGFNGVRPVVRRVYSGSLGSL